MTIRFAITFDYLCPFARNANEAVAEAIEAGEDWEVEFRPFSLSQVHVDDGAPDAWGLPPRAPGASGILALQWGVAMRDADPDHFLAFHKALFAARHERGEVIDDPALLAATAASVGADADRIADLVAEGGPLATVQRQHEESVRTWGVFGVPTFIAGDQAVFVRLMERHNRQDVARVVDMLGWTDLNEFKRTRVPR